MIEVPDAPQVEHVGVIFHFCGEQCHKLFQDAPHKFAEDPAPLLRADSPPIFGPVVPLGLRKLAIA